METIEGDLLHSTNEVYSFDFDFGVEEEFLKLLESFKGDLSHSTDKVHSFDFYFWVEEEFLKISIFFSQFTDNIHSWVVIG